MEARCTNQENYDAIVSIPFMRTGPKLGIRTDACSLLAVDFLSPLTPEKTPVSLLAEQVTAQIIQYFSHPGWEFSLPLETNGTTFQRRVWQALLAIPSGQVLTYGELARSLQTSARAIGNACRRNPILVIIPCHRVVAAQGLGGYSGHTSGAQMDIKRALLAYEQAL